MYRTMLLSLCLLMLTAGMAMAQNSGPEKKNQAKDAKELNGMSIVGNDEAPKSLYIVPWKSSELGIEATISMQLEENAKPVDRDVFLRQLAYYEVSTAQASAVEAIPVALAQQN